MSTVATALPVLAGIVLSNIPLRASLERSRRLKQRLADLVRPALVPLVRSNIRRGAYFRQLSTEAFQLLRL
jgi:hypothetical protein